MRAEFEISGEEKRLIGTGAVQARPLSPSFKGDCFSVDPANAKALAQCPAGDSQELGNNK
jgi:hypothetical protein